MTGPRPSAARVLADAAFGAAPGRSPLPPATSATSRWHRAVALGGQGRHAAAAAELAPLLGDPDAALASLAASTTASLLRQLGGHDLARGWDGRAVALVAGGPTAVALARADALTGLAADALGGSAPATALRLLERARVSAAAVEDPWHRVRVATRVWWVAAEAALRLDDPRGAVAHARAGVAAAENGPSRRHRVKSVLVLAAAEAAASPQLAAEHAEQCRREARVHGLVPLEWAAAMLLGSIPHAENDPGTSERRDAARRAATASHWYLTQRGGLLPAQRRGGTLAAHGAVPGVEQEGWTSDDGDRL